MVYRFFRLISRSCFRRYNIHIMRQYRSQNFFTRIIAGTLFVAIGAAITTSAQTPTPTPTHANILRGEYGRFRANNDVLSYDLDIRIDPDKKTVVGKNTIRFKTLKEYSEATGQDRHSVLVDYNVFQKVAPPEGDPRTLYKPADFDFTLRPGSAAVDAGVRLPGVNDDATGRAPDLGALEIGRPSPQYGPR